MSFFCTIKVLFSEQLNIPAFHDKTTSFPTHSSLLGTVISTLNQWVDQLGPKESPTLQGPYSPLRASNYFCYSHIILPWILIDNIIFVTEWQVMVIVGVYEERRRSSFFFSVFYLINTTNECLYSPLYDILPGAWNTCMFTLSLDTTGNTLPLIFTFLKYVSDTNFSNLSMVIFLCLIIGCDPFSIFYP